MFRPGVLSIVATICPLLAFSCIAAMQPHLFAGEDNQTILSNENKPIVCKLNSYELGNVPPVIFEIVSDFPDGLRLNGQAVAFPKKKFGIQRQPLTNIQVASLLRFHRYDDFIDWRASQLTDLPVEERVDQLKAVSEHDAIFFGLTLDEIRFVSVGLHRQLGDVAGTPSLPTLSQYMVARSNSSVPRRGGEGDSGELLAMPMFVECSPHERRILVHELSAKIEAEIHVASRAFAPDLILQLEPISLEIQARDGEVAFISRHNLSSRQPYFGHILDSDQLANAGCLYFVLNSPDE